MSLCSVGTVFFSALSLSLAVVALHGAFREPDNLFVDEAEVRGRWQGGNGSLMGRRTGRRAVRHGRRYADKNLAGPAGIVADLD